jgi:pilus assembly protein Flp/PilA
VPRTKARVCRAKCKEDTMSLFPLRWLRDDEGQGLAEYALILALIAIVAIIALIFLGNQVSDKFSVIGDAIDSVTP